MAKPPIDRYRYQSDLVDGPARAPYAVVPHATDPLPRVPKALYVGGAGDIVVRGIDGIEDVTFKNVPAGSILSVRASHVRAAGTTATAIVALI